MTYIFTAAQFAGFTKKTLSSDDLLVLENVSFLAELLYQDVKKDIKEVSSQPWPEYLIELALSQRCDRYNRRSTLGKAATHFTQNFCR